MQPQGFGLTHLSPGQYCPRRRRGPRVGYVLACLQDPQQPPPFQVQDAETAITLDRGEDPTSFQATDRDTIVDNLAKSNWFMPAGAVASMKRPRLTSRRAILTWSAG